MTSLPVYALIMAGGVGSRFWPRSRKNKPKQLLNIIGEQSMLQETIARLLPIMNLENIFIVTNKVQAALVEDQMPEFPLGNIIIEPEGRNTAPCIGVATQIIANKNPDALILTMPADHHIAPQVNFESALKKACEFAENKGTLLTFGITPTRPETGYGYIHFEPVSIADGVFKVNRFVEKPDLKTAKEYIETGEYNWNSGMFCWSAQSILTAIETHFTELDHCLNLLAPVLNTSEYAPLLKRLYPDIPSISIDYAIMEKSDQVYQVATDFEWNDVGHWESVYQFSEKDENENAQTGEVWFRETRRSYVYSPHKLTAVIGLDDVLVVDTEDALLICHRDSAQDVKEVVHYLNETGQTDLT